MKREFHARFIEKLGVKLPLLTRRSENEKVGRIPIRFPPTRFFQNYGGENAHLFLFPVSLLFVIFILQSQPPAEFRVIFNAFHFHVDDCLRIRLDPVIVPSDLLRHDVVSLPVPEFIDDGYFFVILLFPADFFVVYDDFGVEYLLFYFLSEVVRYGTNECSL